MSSLNASKFIREHRPTIASMRRLPEPISSAMATVSAERRRPRTTPPNKFSSRTGYDSAFLADFVVALPTPGAERLADVTAVSGNDEGRLDYQNFSIVMSASRRMAMFTAVNIEGARAVDIDRDDDKWSLDGRVPAEAQWGEELYRDNGLDRGHLVRRMDPNWGDHAATANSDTFHFTNCAPQMAAMNQKTWLGLETYILSNARAWAERCSVFTGPVFGERDIRYRGALIPRAFWKVVAFLDDSGRPSATAYLVDQNDELADLSAAFGEYKTYQRSVRGIEAMTGLSFGRLSQYDGFSNEEERLGGATEIWSQIRTLADVRV